MDRDPIPTTAPTTFRAAYSAQFGCPEEAFEERLLNRCLPPHARLLAFFIELLVPDFFVHDLEIMRHAGNGMNLRDVVLEANKLHDAHHLRTGFLRGVLRVRPSGRRLVRAVEAVWGRSR